MKIGISERFGDSATRDLSYAKDFAATMEGLGFNSLWMPEHVVFFSQYRSPYPYHPEGIPPFGPGIGIFDPIILTAALSQATSTLLFATSILILPQRPVLLTAKEIMTLDHVTGGRFLFGVGGGWAAEEYEALGTPWEKRGKRFDDYLRVLRRVWAEEIVAHDSDFVSFEHVMLNPKPVTPGGPPFVIGGDSKAAMRRAARYGQGWYGWWTDNDLEPHLAVLHTILEEEGRVGDPTFKIYLGTPARDQSAEEIRTRIDEARRLGVDQFVIALPIDVSNMEHDLRFWAGTLLGP